MGTLEEQESPDRDTQLQVRQLHVLLMTAMIAVEAMLEEAGASGNHSSVPKGPEPVSEAVFLVGTLIDCPECGEGLYKVVQNASTAGIVLDDGSVLVPLNHSIPSRTVGKPFVCPLCGGRLFQDGQIHTFQYGWR